MAKERDVPVFGVYVDGANRTSNLPGGLRRIENFFLPVPFFPLIW
jgi:hypothetical protein